MSDALLRSGLVYALGAALLIVGPLTVPSARADDEILRARLGALAPLREDEADLGAAVERALSRAHENREAGNEPAALRAERIADATLSLLERRRARHAAELSLEARRREHGELAARLSLAERAREAERTDRARLSPIEPSP